MHNIIYTKTQLLNESWNSRGLLSHNFVDKRFLKLDTGVLLAVYKDGLQTQNVVFATSVDNGFTWNEKARLTFDTTYAGGYTGGLEALTGYNSNGPVWFIEANEELKTIHLYHAVRFSSPSEYIRLLQEVWTYEYEGSDIVMTRVTEGPLIEDPPAIYMDSLVSDIKYNNTLTFITFVSDSTLYFFQNNKRNPESAHWYFWETPAIQDNYFDLISTWVSKDSKVDVLAIQDFGTTYSIVHLNVDSQSGSIQGPTTISSFDVTDLADLNLARDGYGNLLAYWTQFNTAGTEISLYYSMSLDDGITWSTPAAIEYTSGQSDFVDEPTGQKAGRTVLLEGRQGFILGYVRYDELKAKGYIRLLTTEDGETYTLGEQKVAASHDTKDVTGFRFFMPAGDELIDLSMPSQVRIAYQIGQGDNQVGKDSKPVTFAQQILEQEAFPHEDPDPYETDIALNNQLLFNFNLLGSTAESVDYYAQELTGPVTDKYISAFDKQGTSVLLSRYEPIQAARTNGRNAFSLYEEVYVKSFLDDIAYANPVTTGSETFETYIERDTRQILLPPNMYLERTYLLNDGNHQKRTVWILNYGSNEYELTQVVPKFINNQIAYYTANAFVIGSTRDPFTRIIQPTET